MLKLSLSARTESRGAFCFNSLHDSQFHIVGKAPALSFTRAVLADVQAYDDVGVLRFMSKKNGKPCRKCGANEWNTRGDCKACGREIARRQRLKNPDRVRENNRKYYQEHAEELREYSRQYRRDHPEVARKNHQLYAEKNVEKERERKRKYQQSHSLEARERSRQHYLAHPKKYLERGRQWRASHPEAQAALDHRRRTRKTEAGGSFTAAEWKALIEHYGGKCLCCGRDDVSLTADHVVPVAKGGSSNIDNIQPLCKSCNARKWTKIIDYRPDKGLGRWVQRKLFGG